MVSFITRYKVKTHFLQAKQDKKLFQCNNISILFSHLLHSNLYPFYYIVYNNLPLQHPNSILNCTNNLYKYCFAQIVVCGDCGEMFRRIHWNNRGCKSIVWRCLSRLEPTGQECHARTVNETVLENVVVQAINTLLGDKSTYQAQLQQNIAKVIRGAQKTTADGIDK